MNEKNFAKKMLFSLLVSGLIDPCVTDLCSSKGEGAGWTSVLLI